MSVSHEDIRVKVISKLRESILKAIDDIRKSKPQIYLKLRRQLEEYQELIAHREDIPLIIKNEKIIKGVGIPDIEVFGGRILVEVKVKRSEFEGGFEQLIRYAPVYPYAKYAVVTNYSDSEIYRVEQGKLTGTVKISLDSIVEEVLIKRVKIPLSTEKVRNMFNPITLLETELYQIFESYKVKNDALFEAYQNIMRRLYEKASAGEIEKLFIKHSLMQMIVSSCLTVSSGKKTTAEGACSGADIEAEVVLPYLKWWQSVKVTSKPSDEKFLTSLVESIYSRAMLLDWKSGGKDDVFRELYEILIDTETRRKIGEYYTPLWLVEYMVEKLSKDVEILKDKTVLDPFCGSGTFLITAFYRKVREGENPDDAIKEVIGFDINPLAVSIARAELMIAYQSKGKGIVTPLVFNIDSASLLLRKQGEWVSSSFLGELREIEKKIEYVDSPIYTSNEIDFSEILRVEMILRDCFREAIKADKFRHDLESRLDGLKKQVWKGSLTSLIVTTLAEEKIVDAITRLIEKYGNHVWAVSITSLFAPHIIRKVKVDTVITNPPWAQLTEPKGSYGELLRDKAKSFLVDYEKTGQILAGSDISSVLLRGCMNIARREVAFLMPHEVVYTANSYYGLGKILTYSMSKDCDGEIMQVGFDAFQHGRLPCIVFLRKQDGKITCYSIDVKWKGEYSKALHLSDVKCVLGGSESYLEYIKNVIRYIKTSSEDVKERLDVEDVAPMGNYIRGLFGGVKKKGAKTYAGLVFDIIAEDKTARQYSIRLAKTHMKLRIPDLFFNRYWKKLIYVGQIFPFYLNQVLDVLLSSEGNEDLKEFLRNHIIDNLSGEDKMKTELLVEELKQPEKLKLVGRGNYYVIYRRSRTFASFVLTPSDIETLSLDMKRGVVIYDDCSYLTTPYEMKAQYYSAVLNYLVHKVIESGGSFVRHQYLRPIIAILKSGLKWKANKWQTKVAEFGKSLHQEAPKCFANFARGGIRVDRCFMKLKTCDNTKELFNELIRTVDNHVDEKRLHESLRFVCKLEK